MTDSFLKRLGEQNRVLKPAPARKQGYQMHFDSAPYLKYGGTVHIEGSFSTDFLQIPITQQAVVEYQVPWNLSWIQQQAIGTAYCTLCNNKLFFVFEGFDGFLHHINPTTGEPCSHNKVTLHANPHTIQCKCRRVLGVNASWPSVGTTNETYVITNHLDLDGHSCAETYSSLVEFYRERHVTCL